MSCFRLLALLAVLAAIAGSGAQASLTFEPCLTYPLAQEARALAIGDLNGDGRDDAAVIARPSALYIFCQLSDGTLDAPFLLAAPSMPGAVTVGDLNGDGRTDLAAGGNGGLILLYYQQPDGTLGLPVECYSYGSVSGIAVDDLNGDGRADIVASSYEYPYVFVFTQGSDGIFGWPEYLALSGGNGRCVTTLDRNADGKRDIALLFDDQACLLTQNASGGFDAPEYVPTLWAHSLAAGDVTGDGLDDIVYSVGTNQPDAGIGALEQSAGGVFASSVFFAGLDFPQSMAVADIDRDGMKDVVTAHAGYEAISVFPGRSGGLDAGVVFPAPYSNWYDAGSVAVGDMNSDGMPDVAATDWWNGLVVFLQPRQQVDARAPACRAVLSGRIGLNGWYTSAVTISLVSDDGADGSGVGAIHYTVDGVNWLPYAAPFTITAQGTTRVGFCAEDLAGNASQPEWIDIMVDTQRPRLTLRPWIDTLSPPDGRTVTVPVTAMGADRVSGMASLRLTVKDEYGVVEPAVDVTQSFARIRLVASCKDGDKSGRIYTLTLTGRDAAGNVASASAKVRVPYKEQRKRGR